MVEVRHQTGPMGRTLENAWSLRRLTEPELEQVTDPIIRHINYVTARELLKVLLPDYSYFHYDAHGWWWSRTSLDDRSKWKWVAWVSPKGHIHTEDGVWVWEQGEQQTELARRAVTQNMSLRWCRGVWEGSRPTLAAAARLGVPEEVVDAARQWSPPGPPGVPMSTPLAMLDDLGVPGVQIRLQGGVAYRVGQLRKVVHLDGVGWDLYEVVGGVKSGHAPQDALTSDNESLSFAREAMARLVSPDEVRGALDALARQADAS